MLIYLRRAERYCFLIYDFLITVFCYACAQILLEEKYSNFFYITLKEWVVFSLFAICFVVFMFISRNYSKVWATADLRDFSVLSAVCILTTAVFAAISFATIQPKGLFHVNWQCHVFGGALTTVAIVASRIARYSVTLIKRREPKKKNTKRVLIIGAGFGGKKIADDMSNERSKYKIVGFIDDDPVKKGTYFAGKKVFGSRDEIKKICKSQNVDECLIAIPSISPKNKKEIIDIIKETGCALKILPSMDEMINYNTPLRSVRDVSIEDLLSRDSIMLNVDRVGEYIKDKVVVVTGGGGSIGSELCRQIAKFSPKKLYIVDIYENSAYDLKMEFARKRPDLKFEVIIASVRDRVRIEKLFNDLRPEIIFHAAAHKHVPLMEHDPAEAIKNNVFGTLNTARAAHMCGAAKFVLISTDKAVNPTNIMGATKRICEMIVQSINNISSTEFVAVRFGNVLGSNGSVVPLFKKQIEERSPITLTHMDITRYFMTIPEAASLVLEAAAYATGGEIFVLDMGQPVRIYDLAVNLITLSGLVPYKDVDIQITGLRPGEKLYEELLMDEEGLKSTVNEKIFVAKPGHYDFSELTEKLNELLVVANTYNEAKIKQAVKKIVPTYKIGGNAEIEAEKNAQKALNG